MLDMTRRAVRLVRINRSLVSSHSNFAVMTESACCAGRLTIYRIKRLVAAGTGQLALGVTAKSRNDFYALRVKGVKLLTDPLIFSICWQTYNRQLLQVPLFLIDCLGIPRTIHHRIAESSAVWRPDSLAIKGSRVTVVVASRARLERPFDRFESSALMFRVTVDTAYAGCSMRRNDRGSKGGGLMTATASFLHAAL